MSGPLLNDRQVLCPVCRDPIPPGGAVVLEDLRWAHRHCVDVRVSQCGPMRGALEPDYPAATAMEFLQQDPATRLKWLTAHRNHVKILAQRLQNLAEECAWWCVLARSGQNVAAQAEADRIVLEVHRLLGGHIPNLEKKR